MAPEFLRTFAVRLYGETAACARLADDLGLSESHVRNLSTGRRPWTPETMGRLRALLDRVPERIGAEHDSRLRAVAEARATVDAAWGSP